LPGQKKPRKLVDLTLWRIMSNSAGFCPSKAANDFKKWFLSIEGGKLQES